MTTLQFKIPGQPRPARKIPIVLVVSGADIRRAASARAGASFLAMMAIALIREVAAVAITVLWTSFVPSVQ